MHDPQARDREARQPEGRPASGGPDGTTEAGARPEPQADGAAHRMDGIGLAAALALSAALGGLTFSDFSCRPAVGAAPARPALSLSDEPPPVPIRAAAPATSPARVDGEAAADHALKLYNPARIIPRGAVIPAVLEAAASDPAGHPRALVSQDVKGFDGSRVLIPRGSRLVGRYRAGSSADRGQATIVWTRLLLPDGLAMRLDSPTLGEPATETGRPSAEAAAVLLSPADGLAGVQGRPKVPQGVPIPVFAVRDLDFSVETP